MMQEGSFKDFMDVQSCIRILEEYKLGRIDEKECLIKIAKKFEAMQKSSGLDNSSKP